MNRLGFWSAAVILGVATAQAHAFSTLPGYLKDGYKDDAAHKAFLQTVDGLTMKCDVCHKPGADKKAKGHGLNDFGKAFHDVFKHKDFQAAHKEKKTEEAMKLFKTAWDKAIKEKNADGKVFEDFIKEGKLPGKND